MSPLNETEDRELHIKSGGVAVLSPPLLDTFPPPTVTWMVDDLTTLYGIKYAITEPNNDLIILNVAHSDVKAYRYV